AHRPPAGPRTAVPEPRPRLRPPSLAAGHEAVPQYLRARPRRSFRLGRCVRAHGRAAGPRPWGRGAGDHGARGPRGGPGLPRHPAAPEARGVRNRDRRHGVRLFEPQGAGGGGARLPEVRHLARPRHRPQPHQAQPARDARRPFFEDRGQGHRGGDRDGARARHLARDGGPARPGPLPRPPGPGQHRRDRRFVNDPVPPYHEHLSELAKELTERGSQGLVVIDASPLEVIEEQYGSDAFEEVRQRLFKILREQRGKEYRNEDVLTLDRPGGLRFIFFLERKRRRSNPTTIADLKIVQSRMASSLVPNLGRAAFPYCKTPPRIEVGYGMAVYNPLLHPSRIALSAIPSSAGARSSSSSTRRRSPPTASSSRSRRSSSSRTTTFSARRWPTSRTWACPSPSTTWDRATRVWSPSRG